MSRARAIVFLGPSLPARDAERLFPGVIVRGPARQGDVLRALRDDPHVLALVDGVFESQPSVWHQELRIALSEGVHVLGAASMGALRAVELAPFGMIGIGSVYRGYVEGRFIDDADVALLHASAEHDHRPLTVPFVNVVATAEDAVSHQVISTIQAKALLRAARALHYQDRRWPDVLARVRWNDAIRRRFEQFRATHPRDVKAEDARACILAARDLCDAPRRRSTASRTQSSWVRREWLTEQGEAPKADARDGLRVLLLAEWGRSLGLEPDPNRVADIEAASDDVPLARGLRHRFAEALALEEELLEHPELLVAQAPTIAEGHWVDAIRRQIKRSRTS